MTVSKLHFTVNFFIFTLKYEILVLSYGIRAFCFKTKYIFKKHEQLQKIHLCPVHPFFALILFF